MSEIIVPDNTTTTLSGVHFYDTGINQTRRELPFLGGDHIADGMLGLLVYDIMRIEFRGESMRKILAEG